jgi:SAM-dependent methyltransferase
MAAEPLVESTRQDYLRAHLREVPPFRALVRSVECRLFEDAAPFENPILDLGCGDGHFASMAFKGRLHAGIDPNAGAIRDAQLHHPESHEHLLCGSATATPFDDQFFKTVIANCVIEHIPDLDALLAEVWRILQPGGRFLFGVPSHRFGEMLLGSSLLRFLKLRGLAVDYGNWFNGHSLHFHTYDPETWIARLSDAGFTVEYWTYYVSPEGLRAFDLAHYLSVPRLISRKLTGKWVSIQNPIVNRLFDRWLRPHYEAPFPKEGGYIFFQTKKRI